MTYTALYITMIQGVHRRTKRQVKNPHAGPSAIRRRGLFFAAKQHRPRYGITRGRCCYFYLIKKMRTASVTAFSQKMLSFWLQPYHTVPHAKSQSLLSRAVYLCQFFLSSIENIVCRNLTFILHLLIHWLYGFRVALGRVQTQPRYLCFCLHGAPDFCILSVTMSSSPGKPCNFVGQGLSNIQI